MSLPKTTLTGCMSGGKKGSGGMKTISNSCGTKKSTKKTKKK